jgi:hypothetical protein
VSAVCLEAKQCLPNTYSLLNNDGICANNKIFIHFFLKKSHSFQDGPGKPQSCSSYEANTIRPGFTASQARPQNGSCMQACIFRVQGDLNKIDELASKRT